jgi:hypothetical protein
MAHGVFHPVLQGSAALLEGRFADRCGAGADLAALPADLFPCAGRARQVHGVAYTAFLMPGLVMMSVLQNAFANSSSSLIQSKVTGNIVFVLLPPISYFEFFLAYVLASVVRGIVVGAGVLLATFWFAPLGFAEPAWILALP